MPKTPRRAIPTSRDARRRVKQIRKLLRNKRTAKRDRPALLAELDALAPIVSQPPVIVIEPAVVTEPVALSPEVAPDSPALAPEPRLGSTPEKWLRIAEQLEAERIAKRSKQKDAPPAETKAPGEWASPTPTPARPVPNDSEIAKMAKRPHPLAPPNDEPRSLSSEEHEKIASTLISCHAGLTQLSTTDPALSIQILSAVTTQVAESGYAERPFLDGLYRRLHSAKHAKLLVEGDTNLRRFAQNGFSAQHSRAVEAVEFELKAGRPASAHFLATLYINLCQSLLAETLPGDRPRVQRLLPSLAHKPTLAVPQLVYAPSGGGYYPQN